MKSYLLIKKKVSFKKQNARFKRKAQEDFMTFHKDLSKATYLISLACISSICALCEDDLSYLA